MRSNRKPEGLSRREFIATGAAIATAAPVVSAADEPTPRQASGVKVGEVTDTSAIVWARLTADETRHTSGTAPVGKGTITAGFQDGVQYTDEEARRLLGAWIDAVLLVHRSMPE